MKLLTKSCLSLVEMLSEIFTVFHNSFTIFIVLLSSSLASLSASSSVHFNQHHPYHHHHHHHSLHHHCSCCDQCLLAVSLFQMFHLFQLRNVASNLCVDTKFSGGNHRFGLETCTKDSPGLGGEQVEKFFFNELVTEWFR